MLPFGMISTILYCCLFSAIYLRSDGALIKGTIELAHVIGTRLASLAKETTGHDSIQKVFQTILDNQTIEVGDLNGSLIVDGFSRSLATLLESKNSALLDVKHRCEEIDKKFPDDPNIKPFTFFDSKDIAYSGYPTLKRDPTFFADKPISKNISMHHIPTNVYKFRTDVLNFIKKTQMLDPLYRELQLNQPSLVWQYMGAPCGVMSMYPGSIWTATPDLDRYDCRRRGWYLTGAISPKDVVILIDKSGSMTGVNFNIATAAADVLVQSFQENDFFNIIVFDSKTSLVIECFPRLVQSTKTNRERFQQKLFGLSNPSGSGNVGEALNKGYEMLKEAARSELTSSGCHKVLVVLSDELEKFDGMQSILQKLKDSQVRIVSYQIGFGNKKSETLKELASKTAGKYYKLQTIGNVYDTVLNYVTQLEKYTAVNQTMDDNKITYVPLYTDFETKRLVMSVVVKVMKASGKGLFSVAAQDITMTELQDTVPIHQLGILGYGFSINNNGFSLLHPRLRAQQSQFKFSPTVYLTALEMNAKNESQQLMVEMVNRVTGNLETTHYMLLPISTRMRFIEVKMNYYFTPAKKTPFSAGIGIPEFGMKNILLKNFTIDLSEGLRLLNKTSRNILIMTPPWPLCNITAKLQASSVAISKIYPERQEIVDFLAQFDQIPANCDKNLLESIFLSAKVLDNVLNEKWNASRNFKNQVLSVFVATHSGYTKVVFSGFASSLANITGNAIHEEFYGRAAEIHKNQNRTFIFDTRTNDTGDSVIIGSSPIVIGKDKAVVAAVGFTIWQKAVANIMIKYNFTTEKDVRCDDYKNYGCYLVDSDGYIVSWNKNQPLKKRFFGLTEGLVMRNLVANSIYKKHIILDEQAECAESTSSSSSAARIGNTIFGCIYCLFQSILTFFSAITLQLMVRQGDVNAQSSSSKFVNCVQEMYYFKLNKTMLPYEGVTQGEICKKNYALASIPNTNLALIITDRRSSACSYRDWSLDPSPVKVKDKCENIYRHRSQWETCAKQ